ncbi:MAG: 3-deoxy-manno-octulosonate cytidylyltransferase [Deltaproteobacteria bacterium]|jgi:3-deoxy-manno-octulosonate cytidylyltransferase (CMP-KDO synthetase)|nr:3-deoxy-manno-octulosonate cytidylyltransferase [Deltaproteobacteria bacterium]
MPQIFALIPARFHSTRFPGKPLAMIAGKPMIQHVYERALLIPDIANVYVATDSSEIFDRVLEFGGKCIMTSTRHASGSDRISEAAHTLGISDDDIVVNVQGDQPVLNPRHPWVLANTLLNSQEFVVSTLVIPISSPAEINDPNLVKVVFGERGQALYFSRAPIPYPRDGQGSYFKHIGIYAFRASFLYKFVTLPRGNLESLENLEQLRILEHGYSLKVLVGSGVSAEVDVPSDIQKAEEALKLDNDTPLNNPRL